MGTGQGFGGQVPTQHTPLAVSAHDLQSSPQLCFMITDALRAAVESAAWHSKGASDTHRGQEAT